MEIPSVVIKEIRASPTHLMDWFDTQIREAWEWMGMDIPSNSGEPSIGVPTTLGPILRFEAEPMMEPLDRLPGSRGREVGGLDHHSANFPISDAVQDRALLHGESVCSEATLSVLTKLCSQHPCESGVDEHGSTRALLNNDAWHRTVDGAGQEDRMEFDGGSEVATPI